MIRVAIVGSNFGINVLAPAFRLDHRCDVVALAGSDGGRTGEAARLAGIPRSTSNWRELVADDAIDVIAIATPPALQASIAVEALNCGKALFIEKPLAANISGATAVMDAARIARRPVAIDFEFTQLPAWRRARQIIQSGALGPLRHVVVNWQVESYATRLRLKNWKTDPAQGGGVLGNFGSHSLHYLEWFCGSITGLSARSFGLPSEWPTTDATTAIALLFGEGAGASLSVSASSYLGAGHRLEFFGEDGTLVLANATADNMRGFTVRTARRPESVLALVDVDADPRDAGQPDGRIAPVSRIASHLFDAIESGSVVEAGLAAGCRVQRLIEAARLSHQSGRWIEVPETSAPACSCY